jgi:putative Holliday junction resolvase
MSGSSEPERLSSLPIRGRLLGIDYGTKRVGLALSNPDQTIATPLETMPRRDASQDGRYLKKVVVEYSIVGLVVGLPVHMSGAEGAKAREARAFGQWAAESTKLPVAFHDERFTTAMAEEQLWEAQLTHKQRKARRDKVAAQMLLQAYLDSDRSGDPPAAIR